MALIARDATGGLAVPELNIPRPGLRGLGIGGAVAFALLFVDGLINSQTRFDAWALKLIQRVDHSDLGQRARPSSAERDRQRLAPR